MKYNCKELKQQVLVRVGARFRSCLDVKKYHELGKLMVSAQILWSCKCPRKSVWPVVSFPADLFLFLICLKIGCIVL